MKEDSRKKRIETILNKNFSPKELLVRDDSKKHEGHSQVRINAKETHIFIKMTLNNCNITKMDLHRKTSERARKRPVIKTGLCRWYAVRDSNPCCRDENPVS